MPNAPFLPQLLCTVFPSTRVPLYMNTTLLISSRAAIPDLHGYRRQGLQASSFPPTRYKSRTPCMQDKKTLKLFNAPQHSKLQPLHIPSINSSCIMTERVAEVFFVWKNSASHGIQTARR
jgi:hypothetical protein